MNPYIPMLMMLINWSIDTTDPTVVSNIYNCFVAVHALILVVAAFLWFKVLRSDDVGVLTVPVAAGSSTTEQLTVAQYDSRKLRELCLSKIFMPLGITMFIF